jgi:hypothetical protein
MLHHVVLVRTDVSEEHIASIIRVTIIGELNPHDGDDTFLCSIGSYKSHLA